MTGGDVAAGSIGHLFVYGTLRPGDVRWPLLQPWVLDEGAPDSVGGELFDTGLDYPAARFNERSTILGRTYALDPERLDECLVHLDEVEGTVRGLYTRVVVTTTSGRIAWAYEYGAGLDLVPIPGGDWMNR